MDNPEEQQDDPLDVKGRIKGYIIFATALVFFAVQLVTVVEYFSCPQDFTLLLFWGIFLFFQCYEELKDPDETNEPTIMHTMFTAEFRPGLLKIFNQLDPKSFIMFSRACKTLRTIARSSKGIRVKFECNVIVDAYLRNKPVVYLKYYNTVHRHQCAFAGLALKNLQKLPFDFEIEMFVKSDVRDFSVVHEFLANLKWWRIYRVRIEIKDHANLPRVYWKEFAEFIQTSNAKNVDLPREYRPFDRGLPGLPVPHEFCSTYIALPIDSLNAELSLPVGMIANSTIKYLRLAESDLRLSDFNDILKNVLAGKLNEIGDWTLEDVNSDIHKNADFMEGFAGIREIAFDDDLPEERPVMVTSKDEERNYAAVILLTAQGKLLSIIKVARPRWSEVTIRATNRDVGDGIPVAFEPFLA